MHASQAIDNLNRREFLERASTVTALGWSTASANAAARTRSAPRPRPGPGPNAKIQVGLIGCGSMGRANLAACSSQSDVVVTAACDVWPARREAVASQFKATCRTYADFREVLGRADVDAVIIATPPHWHALMAIGACEAGKDFYLQKPMTLHVGESFAVRNAVRRHGVISQIGTQIHAGSNYRRVVEYVRSGRLGPVGVVRTFNVMNQGAAGIGRSQENRLPDGLDWDAWCGPAPLRPFNTLLATDAYNHCSWLDYSGGWTPGMAPHLLDLPVWALDLGFPTCTSSAGGRFTVRDDGDAYDQHEVLWQYPNQTVTWMSSLTNSYGFDFQGSPGPQRRLGMYFHGANGTLVTDYSAFKIVSERKEVERVEAPPQTLPPSPGHEREWLNCIRSRQQPSCNVDYHVRVDVPIALSLLAYRLGRAVRFDPVTERVVGDAEAVRRSIPQYRAPWKFPRHYV